MIVTLPETTSAKLSANLLALREEGGVVALGRVLTLIISASEPEFEASIQAANDASREHPCRVIVLDASLSAEATNATDGGLDAEIRIGADAGASEVIILAPHGAAAADVDTLVTPLLLPDAPIVVWWPQEAPVDVARSLLGSLSQRRITDAAMSAEPIAELDNLAATYAPGNTDLSWARSTLWRGLAAAALDISPAAVHQACILGNGDLPGVRLFAAWLAQALDLDVTIEHDDSATGLTGFRLDQEAGVVALNRPEGSTVVTISTPGQTDQQISLPMRHLSDCLIEDLRRLDPDSTYAKALGALDRVRVQ